MPEENKTPLYVQYAIQIKEIPEPITDWFGSDEYLKSLDSINTKLNLKEDSVSIIPRIILLILVKAISPQELSAEIVKELKITPSAGNAAAKEIRDTIFKPREADFMAFGIDIKKIGTEPVEVAASASRIAIKPPAPQTPPAPAASPVPKPAATVPASKPQTSPSILTPAAPQPAPAPQPKPVTPAPSPRPEPENKNEIKDEAEEAPFMLHKEEVDLGGVKNNIPFSPMIETAPRPGPRPLTSKVEMFGSDQKKPALAPQKVVISNPSVPRIINYTEPKPAPSAQAAPVKTQAAPEAPKPAMPNIDLRSAIKNAVPEQPPKPEIKPQAKAADPKIQGNVVDLRDDN